VNEITPVALPAAVDVVSDPSAARVEIPPVWHFLDQEDLIVCIRSNTPDTPVYYWERDVAAKALPLTEAPTGAVGGAIVNRVLVLYGADSFGAPATPRSLIVRWSDRFDFNEWTPSDVNISGELPLDGGGSRIVGGGLTGFGQCVWTDKRLALLTETGDINSVFARRYIAGSGGLMANLSWCEVDGRVWYFDDARNLRVYDGGTPRTISNPIRLGTIERLSDREVARAYMVANPEFEEILLWYPVGNSDVPNACVVYNYGDDSWHFWSHERGAYAGRLGVIRSLGADGQGNLWQHDLDVSLPSPWLLGTSAFGTKKEIPVSDVEPFDAYWETNLITLESPTQDAWQGVRVLMDHLPSPADGAEGDKATLTVAGYRDATARGDVQTTSQLFEQGQAEADFRSAGKAITLKCEMSGKTVWRFGSVDVAAARRGQR
jgi:hypothetical protein